MRLVGFPYSPFLLVSHDILWMWVKTVDRLSQMEWVVNKQVKFHRLIGIHSIGPWAIATSPAISRGPCQRFQGLLGQLELRREVGPWDAGLSSHPFGFLQEMVGL